uniref:uncharacterized protein n=1 Tax=Centroberyx gerrardi TaxID=166262 RepID=UPI003AAB8B48
MGRPSPENTAQHFQFLHKGMSFILLLILGNMLSVTPSGLEKDLYCTNDYVDTMFCHFKPTSDQPDCTEYSLNLTGNILEKPKVHCNFKRREGFSGACCCSIKMIFVLGETHTATLLKGGQELKSKIISIKDSIKPKTPTVKVEETENGNFRVTWKTNYKATTLNDDITSTVTYGKKGEEKTDMVHKVVGTATSSVILRKDLQPSTAYVVSVKTFASFSKHSSDSSEECEFTTLFTSKTQTIHVRVGKTCLKSLLRVLTLTLFYVHFTADFDIFLAVIISLSFAAVIITSVVFGCYVRFKAKWWDKIAECPNPTLLNMLPGEQKLLQPLQTHFSSIYVDLSVLNDGKPWSKCSLTDTSSESYQQSSGINTGSSSLGYANTLPADIITNVQEALCKALPQLALMSSVTNSSLTESHKDNGLLSTAYSPCSVTQDDLNSPGSSSFDNKTYSILIPSSQQITSGSSENHMQPVVSCDPAYLPSEGDILRNACPDQQVPACLVTGQQDAVLPLVVSSCMQTDFSYQPCNAEDSGLTSVSSGISTSASSDLVSRVEAGCESFDEAVSGATNPTETTQDVYIEKAPICDENPCYGSLPAPSHSFPLVDDDYQAFQSLVKQPNVLFPDQSSGEQLGKYPEEFSSKTAQSSLGTALPDLQIYSAQGGQCPPPDLERPLLSLLSTDHSELVIIDSGYQCV